MLYTYHVFAYHGISGLLDLLYVHFSLLCISEYYMPCFKIILFLELQGSFANLPFLKLFSLPLNQMFIYLVKCLVPVLVHSFQYKQQSVFPKQC